MFRGCGYISLRITEQLDKNTMFLKGQKQSHQKAYMNSFPLNSNQPKFKVRTSREQVSEHMPVLPV